MKPTVTVEPYGADLMVRCSECGDVEQVTFTGSGREARRDHLRYMHPTEDEQALDDVRAAEWELPGCTRCGHDDHVAVECPHVGAEVYPL